MGFFNIYNKATSLNNNLGYIWEVSVVIFKKWNLLLILILISEFLEQKLRKEQELEFYLKELDELQRKIGYLKQEVSLTNTIINIL